jgi:hypothetical protein
MATNQDAIKTTEQKVSLIFILNLILNAADGLVNKIKYGASVRKRLARRFGLKWKFRRSY